MRSMHTASRRIATGCLGLALSGFLASAPLQAQESPSPEATPLDVLSAEAGATSTPATPSPGPVVPPPMSPSPHVSPPPAATAPPRQEPSGRSEGSGFTLQVRKSWGNLLGVPHPISGYPLDDDGWAGTFGWWLGDFFIGGDVGFALGDFYDDVVAFGVTSQRIIERLDATQVRSVAHAMLTSNNGDFIVISVTAGIGLFHSIWQGLGLGGELTLSYVTAAGSDAPDDVSGIAIGGAFYVEWSALRGGEGR